MKTEPVKVNKAEFWLSSGIHVVFDIDGCYVNLYKHACEHRGVRTRRLPSIINALWLAKNYPPKQLQDQ